MNCNESKYFQRVLPEGWYNLRSVASTQYERMHQLQKAFKNNQTLEAQCVLADNKFNLYVDLGCGIKGFIPREEVSISCGEDSLPKPSACISQVNKTVQFKVKTLEENSSGEIKVLLSRKDAQQDALRWMTENVYEGMVLKGIVRNMEQYGAFVDVGAGITSLLHIQNISVTRIRHPKDRFFIGERIEVVVKHFDRETGRINLSHKELLGTWEENAQEFAEGSTVIAVAREHCETGIFIELKPNLVGLAEKREGVTYGQVVSVFIRRIVPEKKKVKLAIVG